MFGMLGMGLTDQGDSLKAKEVLYTCLEEIPSYQLEHDYYSVELFRGLYIVGEEEKALVIANEIKDNAIQYLDLVVQLDRGRRHDLDYVTGLNMQALISIYNMAEEMGLNELAGSLEQDVDRYYNELFMRRI